MTPEKIEQVVAILKMPVESTKERKGISYNGGKIISYQGYGDRLDPDMSDFAVGFYNILLKPLGIKILDENYNVISMDFLGDTMNSFNNIANRVKEAGPCKDKRTPFEEWPKFLQDYYIKYHCLANFWILPLLIGRTLENDSLNKAKRVYDYMDRFLKLVMPRIGSEEQDIYIEYFNCFASDEDFKNFHKINCYFNEDGSIKVYTKGKVENVVKTASDLIDARAYELATSEIGEDLWNYFNSLGLIK